MLVSMKEMLQAAEEGGYAVGGFNCPGLEYVYAVVRAAEECRKPAILSFPQVHERTVPLRVIAPILLQAAREASVPICVHLDHGSSIDYIHDALEFGFPSVMYDGSKLGFEENIRNTKAVVELAAKYGADVEAELGGISGDEAGIAADDGTPVSKLTDPEEAVRFVEETGIDFLAPSIGTAHGFYTAAPKIDLELIDTLHRRCKIPLVMHGGSGVSAEDYAASIKRGIRKINYYSYMAKAGVDGTKRLLESRDVKYFHELIPAATEAMAEDVAGAIRLFHP